MYRQCGVVHNINKALSRKGVLMSNQKPTAKPNRRRRQDARGRKKKEMPVHGHGLKRTLGRHINPGGASRRPR